MYYQQNPNGFYPQQGYYPQQPQQQAYPQQGFHQTPQSFGGYYQPQYQGQSMHDELNSAMVNLDNTMQQTQSQPTAMMQSNGYYPQQGFQQAPSQGYYPQQPQGISPQYQGGYNNQPMNTYQAQRQQNPLFDFYKDAERALSSAILHDSQNRPNAMNVFAKLNLDRFGDQSDWFQRFSTVLGMLIYRDVRDYGNDVQGTIIKFTPVVYKAMLADIATSQPNIAKSIPNNIRGQLNATIQSYNKLQSDITTYGKQRTTPTNVHPPQQQSHHHVPPNQHTGDWSMFNGEEYEPPRMPGELTRSNMLVDLPDEEDVSVNEGYGYADDNFYASHQTEPPEPPRQTEPETVAPSQQVTRRTVRGVTTPPQTTPLKTNAQTPHQIKQEMIDSDEVIYSRDFDIDEHRDRVSNQSKTFPNANWKQQQPPENQTDGMIVNNERHYGLGQPLNDFEDDGDLREGTNFKYGSDGVPYRIDVEGASVDYNEDTDSLFDEVMNDNDDVDQPPHHKPFTATSNLMKSFNQVMVKGFSSNLEAEMPNVTGMSNMQNLNENTATNEVVSENVKSVYEIGETIVTDTVLMTEGYNRRVPLMPAFIAGKQHVVVVPTKNYNVIVARPIGDMMKYEQHELEWTKKHQVKSLQNIFDTPGNVEYGGNVLEEFATNKVDIDELADRVISAAAAEDPEEQHNLETFLASTPTIVMDDLIVSDSEDLFTEPFARIHLALGDENEVDIDGMLIQYRRLVSTPYQLPTTEMTTLRGLQLATVADDIVERIENFQSETNIPERAVAKLNQCATVWVQRLIQSEFNPDWTLDSLTLDFDDLSEEVENVYGEAGVLRLNDIYVRAVQNTYAFWDKLAIDAIDPAATDALGLDQDDSLTVIGHVEHITLLPFDYNDYPLAFIGDVGIIDPTALPQLYGMLARTIDAQKTHVAEFKFVTKDNAVYKFFKAVAGDEILISRN